MRPGIFRLAHRIRHQHQAQRAGGRVYQLTDPRERRVARVPQRRDPAQRRHGLLKQPRRFELISGVSSAKPVTSPPGRAMLSASPAPTGSIAAGMTIGIVYSTNSRSRRATETTRNSVAPKYPRGGAHTLRASETPGRLGSRLTAAVTAWGSRGERLQGAFHELIWTPAPGQLIKGSQSLNFVPFSRTQGRTCIALAYRPRVIWSSDVTQLAGRCTPKASHPTWHGAGPQECVTLAKCIHPQSIGLTRSPGVEGLWPLGRCLGSLRLRLR